MSKKYLTLEEAAQHLSIPKEELMRLREKGEIRGFADRGNWKFKWEDVETLLRRKQADSDPETPIFAGGASDSDVRLVSDSGIISDSGARLGQDDSDSDIRISAEAEDSDSDVKLIDTAEDDSDSDVKMVEDDSDSDVKMVGDDSDSDVKIVADPDSDITLAPQGKGDTDSDVKLVGDDSGSDISLAPGPADRTDSDIRLVGSDSDVRLVEAATDQGASDSDISLVRSGDSAVSVDLGDSDDSGSVVLSEESGIALTEDSSMTLAAESGISLEAPADSGISLDVTEEGITLAGESGIALSPLASDSAKTSPMMKAARRDEGTGTQFEIPSVMEDDDADFDFDVAAEDDDTGVFALADDRTDEQTTLVEAMEDSGEFDDAQFALDESGELSDELDFDTGTVEELDVFEEEEGEFEEGFTSGVSHADFAAPVSRAAPVEVDWGTGPFVGLLISTGLLVIVGVVMFDLVRSMWMWNEPGPLASMFLGALRGLYGT